MKMANQLSIAQQQPRSPTIVLTSISDREQVNLLTDFTQLSNNLFSLHDKIYCILVINTVGELLQQHIRNTDSDVYIIKEPTRLVWSRNYNYLGFCFCLLHAKSRPKDPNLSDHDRPLDEFGKDDALRMGKLIRDKKDLVPDFIISSNALRAKTTAESC